jgi:hypothetical protein
VDREINGINIQAAEIAAAFVRGLAASLIDKNSPNASAAAAKKCPRLSHFCWSSSPTNRR